MCITQRKNKFIVYLNIEEYGQDVIFIFNSNILLSYRLL